MTIHTHKSPVKKSDAQKSSPEAGSQGVFPLSIVRDRPGYHWFVVGTVCVGAFMAALDASIVNIALPKMQRHFQVHLNVIEWVSLAYLLTLGALIVPLGRLADMYGRRWMYTLGFSIFILGSLLCGISPSLPFLLASRVVQALGAAMLQANSVSIITAATPMKARGKAIGIQGSAQAIGLSIGPAVGGALLSITSWRWIFFVNLPIGIIGTILGVLMLPQDVKRKERGSFDFVGAVLLAPTLVALIYLLNTGVKLGWSSPGLLVSLFVSVAGLFAFTLVERSSKSPLVDLGLFKNPVFSLGNLTGILSFTIMYAITLLSPFYLDIVEGMGSFSAGLYMTVIPIGMTIFTPIAGAIADKFGTRLLTISGMVCATAGSLLLSFMSGTLTHLFLVSGLFLVGVGLGLFTPPNNSSVMSSAPKQRLGVAGGILNMSRTLGMGLGVTLGGLSLQVLLAFHGAKSEHLATLSQMIPSFREAYQVIAILGVLAIILSGFRQLKTLKTAP